MLGEVLGQREAYKISALMLEGNFEEIYLGMQVHNEIEGTPKEAESI